MSANKIKQGFTIVELMMSMVAFAIMILAVGSLLYYGWLGWRKYTHSVNMQRDAVLAMEWIAREIRNSNISEITHDSSGIYFSPGVVRTNAVSIGTSDIAVFPGVNITDFAVSSISNAVTVGFTLFTDGNADRNDYEITVETRN